MGITSVSVRAGMEDHAEPRAERVLGFQSCTSSFTSLFRLLCLFFYCYLSHVALNPVSSHALNVVHTLIINSLHMTSGCLVSCLVSLSKHFPPISVVLHILQMGIVLPATIRKRQRHMRMITVEVSLLREKRLPNFNVPM